MNKFKVSSKLAKVFEGKTMPKVRNMDVIVEALCNEEAMKQKYLNELFNEEEELEEEEDEEEDELSKEANSKEDAKWKEIQNNAYVLGRVYVVT